MDLAAVCLPFPEQEQRNLEDLTRDFLDLVCFTHNLDYSFYIFYFPCLSERSKARLPGDCPQGNFAVFVEWVLVNNRSLFTICPTEEDVTCPTPEPNQTSATPTMHREYEAIFVLEPEPHMESDQLFEPTTLSCEEGILVECDGMGRSPAHTPAAEDELHLASVNYFEDLEEDIPLSLLLPLVPPSSKSPAGPT